MSVAPVVRGRSVPVVDQWTQRELRDALGFFCTGISVIATGGADPVGMTTNSFSSVSLDPPLVLFCARAGSQVSRRVRRGDPFTVNFLTSEQESVAGHFSSPDRGSGPQSFDIIRWTWGAQVDAPVFTDASIVLECSTEVVHRAGDHLIYIGNVLAIHPTDRPVDTLVYLNGAYRQLPRFAPEP